MAYQSNADNKNINKQIITSKEIPSQKMFSESSRATSSLYEPYQLRPYNPNELWQKKGNYDLFDEMRHDDSISGLLSLKKFFILNGKINIISDDEEVKEFLEMNFEYYFNGFFEKALYNILSSIDYGYSLTEKIFSYEDVPGFGKKIILSKLKTRPPHTFEFDVDDYGNIIKIRQDNNQGEDIILDPKKMIHYTYQADFDNPYGSSELNLGVYRAWWSKNAIIKFWNIFLERFGSPTVIGTYKAGMIQHKEDLKQVLKNIQAKTSVVIPEGVEIDLLAAGEGKGQSGFEQAINKYDSMIARKMLIPDLMGFSGSETGGGSYALGKEQFNLVYNNIQHEKENLIRIINKEIIYPLVTWNFGTNKFAKIEIAQPDSERKEKDLKVWLDAVKSGKIPLTDTHINWFLKQVNAPEIEEEELEEIKIKAEEVQAAIQGNSEEEKIDGNEEDNKTEEGEKDSETNSETNSPEKDKTSISDKEKDSEEEEIDKLKPPVKKEKKFVKLSRELTTYEKKVDFTKIISRTELLEWMYKLSLGHIFKLVINGLMDDIRKQHIVEGKKLDKINKLILRHDAKVLKILNQMGFDGYKLGVETANQDKKFSIISVTEDPAAMDIIEQYAFYTRSVEFGFIRDKVKPILIEAIRAGEGIATVTKQINNALKGYDISYTIDAYEKVKALAVKYDYDNVDDLIKDAYKLPLIDQEIINRYVIPIDSKVGGHRLETIARTNIASATNEARLIEFNILVATGDIQAFQYSAIRDEVTTEICKALDMKIFSTDEARYYNPPNHHSCRSLLIPIFIDEEFTLDTMPPTKKDQGNFLKIIKEEK